MELVLRVVALTIATLTLFIAVRRVITLVSHIVWARLVAVDGMVAFAITHGEDGAHRVRFEVGGPGIFHNVAMQLMGADDPPAPPPRRSTMTAGDDPIEWTFTVPAAGDAWVLVTWVRPYLEGIDSEAIAQRLDRPQMYQWRWYSEATRFTRTAIQYLARRSSSRIARAVSQRPVYGRWRRTASTEPSDMVGPADWPPPAKGPSGPVSRPRFLIGRR